VKYCANLLTCGWTGEATVSRNIPIFDRQSGTVLMSVRLSGRCPECGEETVDDRPNLLVNLTKAVSKRNQLLQDIQTLKVRRSMNV
jgi:hypothetical protein